MMGTFFTYFGFAIIVFISVYCFQYIQIFNNCKDLRVGLT